MKRILLIVAMLCFATGIKAQDPNQPNIVLTVVDGKIVAQRSGFGTFTVEVLAETSNGTQSQLCYVTEPVQTLELSGNPQVKAVDWNWLQGVVDGNVDTMFVYQLPYHGCQRAVAHALSHADLQIYRGNFTNFRVWQFNVKPDTKIYPMRSGEVIFVHEDKKVVIEHSDGSQAEYSVLGDDIRVVEGEQVTTKTQLGTAGKIDGKTMVRVSVYYYRSNPNRMYNMFSQTVYLDPYFKKGRLKDGKKY